MTDLNKLRSAFESNEYIKSIIQNFEWSEKFNNYQIKECVINGDVFDLLEAKNDEQLLNGAWFGWQEKAKAQAVPEGFVVVSQKDLLELTIAINAVDLATHTESKTNEVREMWQQVALKLMALGTSQEPTND